MNDYEFVRPSREARRPIRLESVVVANRGSVDRLLQ
jgi:hypothetical protein